MRTRNKRSGLKAALAITRAKYRIQMFLLDEAGQDLVEYAIVAALISLGAIAGMRGVATAIGNAFTHVATRFSTYTS